MATTKQIFNAGSQKVEEATLEVDANNEIVATFASGRILKFPAGITADELDAYIAEHEAVNTGQEVLTQEYLNAKFAEQQASHAAIGEVLLPTDPSATVDVSGIPEATIINNSANAQDGVKTNAPVEPTTPTA